MPLKYYGNFQKNCTADVTFTSVAACVSGFLHHVVSMCMSHVFLLTLTTLNLWQVNKARIKGPCVSEKCLIYLHADWLPLLVRLPGYMAAVCGKL